MTGNDSITFSGGGADFNSDFTSAPGPLTGSYIGMLPIAWDFVVSDSNHSTIHWSVQVLLYPNGINSNSVQLLFQGATQGGEIKGGASPDVGLTGDPSARWQIDLFSTIVGAPVGDVVTTTVNYIDINALPPVSGVPEPSTLLLTAVSAVGLLWRRRLRSRGTSR